MIKQLHYLIVVKHPTCQCINSRDISLDFFFILVSVKLHHFIPFSIFNIFGQACNLILGSRENLQPKSSSDSCLHLLRSYQYCWRRALLRQAALLTRRNCLESLFLGHNSVIITAMNHRPNPLDHVARFRLIQMHSFLNCQIQISNSVFCPRRFENWFNVEDKSKR